MPRRRLKGDPAMIPPKRRTPLQQTQLGLRGASTILLAALIATLLALPAAAMPSAGAKQFAALANDASGVMANPAGLMRLERRSVLFEMTAPDPGAPDAGTKIDRL